MLQLVNVSKRFGETQVLVPTDLAVPAGRTTVLIGPSGCGKSTLLRIMIGLLASDTGSVRFEDVEVTPDNTMLMRRRMGYVLQDGGLFPHLTARENVAIMARYLKTDAKAAIDARVVELAELTRLPLEALDRYVAQLSGGQRQRLGIMRALMLDPPLVLLDEPMGALDPLVRYDLQEDLRRIFQTLAKTVVLVTHDMAEAAFFGDEIVLLGAGQIVQRGTIDELVTSPASDFVRKFLSAQRALAKP